MICFCIASGSSLTQDDVDLCRGLGKVYAVKECALLAPWADVLYAADGDWWDKHKERWQGFKGEKWTCNKEAAERYQLNYMATDSLLKWSDKQGLIATGHNSGFQIVNMADLDGADLIILLGYDMGFTNKKHWFDASYPRESRTSRYDVWLKKFEEAKPLIRARVINCTRQTKLKCFEQMDLNDAIEEIKSGLAWENLNEKI